MDECSEKRWSGTSNRVTMPLGVNVSSGNRRTGGCWAKTVCSSARESGDVGGSAIAGNESCKLGMFSNEGPCRRSHPFGR